MGHPKDQAFTVLLVEDEGIIRMASAAILEDAGYDVLEAVDAEEALATLNDHPEVDVVVTDVQMPGKLDGLQLIEVIAHDYPQVQTLVTSGRASLREARESGAVKFLAKPYTAAGIQSAVRMLALEARK
ncbi:MAG TPA: response regulator [Rhizomicrobium sp.]|jgi:CheY-like chemotaxis protein